MRCAKAGTIAALVVTSAIRAVAVAAADPSPESRYLQGLHDVGISAEQTSSLLIVGFFACAELINGTNPNELAVRIAGENPDLTQRGAALLLNVASTTLCADESLPLATVPDDPGGDAPAPRIAGWTVRPAVIPSRSGRSTPRSAG